jgi:hypothetical protein
MMISDKRLVVNSPVTGDSIIVFYKAGAFTVSDHKLVINAPVAGDSIIVFYSAYANNLSSDSVVINLPYKYREQLIQGALIRAKTAYSM